MLKTKSFKKVILLIAIIVTGCFIVSLPAMAREVYKIGGIFAVTGRASFLGDPEKKSMEMVIKTINDKGGIDGHLLKGIIYDTEGDPTKAAMAVSKLINKDKVIAIIGPSLTPTSLAVIPFVEKAKVPLISCAAGVAITQPVKPWVFKTAQSDVLAVAAVYRHMKKQGIKKIGIITVSNAFGESGKQQLQKQAAEYGIKIVRTESFGNKDTDMTAQLTKIRKAAPDAIVCWGTNPGPAVVAKNVDQLGLNIPLYQSHGVASPKFIKLAGRSAEGIYLPTGKLLVARLLPEKDIQKKALMNYINNFETKYNSSVSGFGGYAYDAMNILAKALKGTNGNKEKIRKALEGLKGHVGVTGVFNFTKEEHNGLGADAFVMVRIHNGTWELLK
ncbi:MAG: branched-chain amino acid transport system substrate-binding protein [Desulfobacteraceae bacterium Eth-SRB1]|nr:MAG: branched-chain amino acid transport system substrate-binding protein [Desulfobacteraceae bacterium Eth-SRB1]